MALVVTKKTTLPSALLGSYGYVAVNGSTILVVDTSFGPNLYRSTNGGDTWTTTAAPLNENVEALRFNGSYFLMLGSHSGALRWAKSTDGSSWTTGTTGGATATRNNLVWNGSRWGACDNFSAFYYSTDGQTWTTVSGVGNQLVALLWDGTRFCAMNQGTPSAPAHFYTSADGSSWTNQGTIISSSPYNHRDLLFSGSAYVADNANNDIHRRSPTGTSWSVISSLTGTMIGATGGSILMTPSNLGDSVTAFKMSSDGATWTDVPFTFVGSGSFSVWGAQRMFQSGTKFYTASGSYLLIIDLVPPSDFWTNFLGSVEVI